MKLLYATRFWSIFLVPNTQQQLQLSTNPISVFEMENKSIQNQLHLLIGLIADNYERKCSIYRYCGKRCVHIFMKMWENENAHLKTCHTKLTASPVQTLRRLEIPICDVSKQANAGFWG